MATTQSATKSATFASGTLTEDAFESIASMNHKIRLPDISQNAASSIPTYEQVVRNGSPLMKADWLEFAKFYKNYRLDF